jgi:hypothetical protein
VRCVGNAALSGIEAHPAKLGMCYTGQQWLLCRVAAVEVLETDAKSSCHGHVELGMNRGGDAVF